MWFIQRKLHIITWLTKNPMRDVSSLRRHHHRACWHIANALAISWRTSSFIVIRCYLQRVMNRFNFFCCMQFTFYVTSQKRKIIESSGWIKKKTKMSTKKKYERDFFSLLLLRFCCRMSFFKKRSEYLNKIDSCW